MAIVSVCHNVNTTKVRCRNIISKNETENEIEFMEKSRV